jgi:hypothetical protein
MYIEEAIVTELSAITGLTSKVFPIEAQQGTATPYLTYRVNGGERARTLIGHDGLVTANYQLDAFHTTYSNVLALRRLILTELKTWERTNLGSSGPYIQGCTITEEPVETYDDETSLFQSTIDIQLIYTES